MRKRIPIIIGLINMLLHTNGKVTVTVNNEILPELVSCFCKDGYVIFRPVDGDYYETIEYYMNNIKEITIHCDFGTETKK